jgi:hypothetical protein
MSGEQSLTSCVQNFRRDERDIARIANLPAGRRWRAFCFGRPTSSYVVGVDSSPDVGERPSRAPAAAGSGRAHRGWRALHFAKHFPGGRPLVILPAVFLNFRARQTGFFNPKAPGKCFSEADAMAFHSGAETTGTTVGAHVPNWKSGRA